MLGPDQEHIVSSFEKELKGLDNMIARMGGLAESQLANAIDALVTRDGHRAAEIVTGDKQIDILEEQLADQTIRMLALRQPMADDLRAVIVALKVSSLIERIGDYGKNVAKRTVALSQTPPIEATKTIRTMGNLVQDMIKDVLDAYIHRDVQRADDVRLKDEEVDHLHTSLFRELLTYMMEDPRNITTCTHLMFVAKNIERIGDHATNIAENIHFLVTGHVPEDERPKEDNSSYTVVRTDDDESCD